jgi:hypothetical protein
VATISWVLVYLSTLARLVPRYDGDALALEVFANEWLYDDEPEVAKFREERREKLFTRRTTIRQVRQTYSSKTLGENNSLESLSGAIGANFGRIKQYFADASNDVSLKQLLIEREHFALDGSDEVKLFFDQRVAGDGLPTPRSVLNALSQGNEASPRSYRLYFVTGSSESGKTLFSLHHLRNVRNDTNLPSVTMYIKPVEFCQQVDFSSPNAPQRLV